MHSSAPFRSRETVLALMVQVDEKVRGTRLVAKCLGIFRDYGT